nr:hypothetical protein [Nannocystis sp.]
MVAHHQREAVAVDPGAARQQRHSVGALPIRVEHHRQVAVAQPLDLLLDELGAKAGDHEDVVGARGSAGGDRTREQRLTHHLDQRLREAFGVAVGGEAATHPGRQDDRGVRHLAGG